MCTFFSEDGSSDDYIMRSRINSASTTYNNSIYLIGGEGVSGEYTERYDIKDGQSHSAFKLPYPISRHCAVTFQDKIWIIGGFSKSEEEISYRTQTLEYHDPHWFWHEGPELIYGRWGHSCVVTQSRFHDAEVIVIAGGFGEYGGLIDSVEFMFDNKWERGTYNLHIV